MLNYTTNRILEIPQDIKLELNNGTLTLKAGSKVYIPNGFEADGTTPKFDTVIVDNDLDIAKTDIGRLNNMVCYRDEEGELVKKWSQWTPEDIYSGLSAPEVSGNSLWYDTTNNMIKEYYADVKSWKFYRSSFPLCTYNATATAVTSINQVFNGFGYIGSTIFALPGVKGLISNGRGINGNYKNLPMSTEAVKLYTFDETNAFISNVWVDSEGNFGGFSTQLVYDRRRNEVVYSVDGSQRLYLKAGDINVVEGKIKEFNNPYAPNFNTYLTNELASMSMPSNKYIDLTLGASGTTYSAPANGWFCLIGPIGASGYIGNGYIGATTTGTSNYGLNVILPVKKGEVVNILYTSATIMRFAYAQGDQ